MENSLKKLVKSFLKKLYFQRFAQKVVIKNFLPSFFVKIGGDFFTLRSVLTSTVRPLRHSQARDTSHVGRGLCANIACCRFVWLFPFVMARNDSGGLIIGFSSGEAVAIATDEESMA